MASSSSSAATSLQLPQKKYDVFLSFRGEDTRRTFTGHLYEGLKNRGIFTFQDDKRLEYGDSISEELLKAIQESQVAVIVFSKKYAISRWCLNELVKIMECKDKNGQIVVPIFYDVDPSHVRNQTESFAEAFAKHDLRYKDDAGGMLKMQEWRNALTAAANLKGFDIRDGIEADCIQHIVDQVSSKLCKTSISYLQNMVGINGHLEKVKSLLEMEINDIVQIVGIWGMGGVGKTTVARAIFDTLSSQFEAACFVADIKENKSGLHSLQNVLLSELLKENIRVNNKEDGKHMIARRLSFKKVLVVLDDIDHRDHLDYLAGDVGWYGNGSRIIATTRDKHLLKGMNDAVYEVTTLPDNDAIKLFNQYAFKEEVPDEGLKNLSLKVVSYANGLPLALKVWGSFLHKRDITEWTSAIEQMRINSNSEIVEKLKISYDGLEPVQQDIFLDIACFLRGEQKEQIMQILESCYSGVVDIGLSVLTDKSLVFISKYNTIEMHDLIQDMGRYVVKMQKDPGERSRIWDMEDFKEVMINNTGTVEAIWFTCYGQKLYASKEAMKNMRRLRILCIHNFFGGSNCDDGSIEYLSNNLRWFKWNLYPWESLPENFEPTKLVRLEISGSKLRHLWKETKYLPSLRSLNLIYSHSLMQTPDFSGMPNLEELNLEGCYCLEEVHPSLKCCRKLIKLNLQFCNGLVRFPDILGRRMNPVLDIQMYGLGIRELPSSLFQHQTHVSELELSSMRHLVALPSSIGILKGLVKLDVSYCSKLESLPKEIGDLENLEELNAKNTLISQPPSSIVRLNNLKDLSFAKYVHRFEDSKENFVFPQLNGGLRSLEILDLSNCNLIDGGLPEDIGCLSSLKYLHLSGNNFEHLPQSIAQLGALRSLDLSHCKRLKELPRSMRMPSLETLNLSGCNLIDGGLPEDIGCLSSLKDLNLNGNNFEHLAQSIAQLDALRSLRLIACKRLTQLPKFPQRLHTIDADWRNDRMCNSLFQNISLLQHDISASDSLSLRVFTSKILGTEKIPNWFHHRVRGSGTKVSINLPENWYKSDNFLGFAVCFNGTLYEKPIDITAHLIPLCDDGMSFMTQKLVLSNHSEYSICNIYFFLVPLSALWDTSKTNGKTPNDYGCIRLSFSGKMNKFGFRLVYKDEAAEHCIGTKRSRDEDSEHHDEASCSPSRKQRSQVEAPVSWKSLQLFPTRPGF